MGEWLWHIIHSQRRVAQGSERGGFSPRNRRDIFRLPSKSSRIVLASRLGRALISPLACELYAGGLPEQPA
jgi:hypothetical protein